MKFRELFFCPVKSLWAQSGASYTWQCQVGTLLYRLGLPRWKPPPPSSKMYFYSLLLLFFLKFLSLFAATVSPLTVHTNMVCVFTGTDALCWEQELHWAWFASPGGLLFVHKLFCRGPIPPHCRVRQSGPCVEETSSVSTDFETPPFLSTNFV